LSSQRGGGVRKRGYIGLWARLLSAAALPKNNACMLDSYYYFHIIVVISENKGECMPAKQVCMHDGPCYIFIHFSYYLLIACFVA
jgi:hypothetical protein